MNKKLLITGSVLGVLGIVLGAFAAHGLESKLDEDAIKTFETGVRYQMYHALLLLVLGGTKFLKNKTKSIMFYMVIFGVLFFSGSIYGLATNTMSTFDFTTIALITPFGGLLLIGAWLLMLIELIKAKVD